MNKKNINLVIVDDHQIVIDGISSLLHGHPFIKIVAASTSAKEIIKILNSIDNVDVLITDIMMPEMSGDQLAKHIKTNFPAIKILALSMSGQGETVNAMLNDSDIAGYVLKNISKTELIQAIEKIANGGIYFSEEVLKELETFSNIQTQNIDAQITIREKEIIQLIEKELSNKQIADTLFISERTVETHRKNIYRKTNTNSVIGLIKYAYQHKII